MGIESLAMMLLAVLCVAVLLYGLFYFLGRMALPEPVRMMILLVVVIIIVVWFIRYILPGIGF